MYTSQRYHDKVTSQPQKGASLAEVEFVGGAREELRALPKDAQRNLGYALWRLQLGQTLSDSTPVRAVGPGVYELRDEDERAWYRVLYRKQTKGVIYVLHCFEKRTNQIEQKDINTAKIRLKWVQEQQRKEARDAKHGVGTQVPSSKRKRP